MPRVRAAAARLTAARADAADRIASLDRGLRELAEQQALTTHDDEHDPEGVTIAYQRAQLHSLLTGARAELAAIDQAEDRLRAGRYGWCTRCGASISDARLDALPATPHCLDCAAAPRRR
jgi:RNA polymerase-binding transcription factor DksA